eukprot:scaffold54927_cov31-Tisochrysis_lutea.AAC.4
MAPDIRRTRSLSGWPWLSGGSVGGSRLSERESISLTAGGSEPGVPTAIVPRSVTKALISIGHRRAVR